MNYNFLSRKGLLIAFGIAIVAIVIMFIPIMGGIDAFEALPDDANIRATSEEGSIFETGIFVSIVLMAIAFGLALLLSLVNVFSNVRNAKRGLIAFGVLVVIFAIFISTADTNLSESIATAVNNPDYDINGDMSIYKMISGAITGTLVLLGLAFALMVIMEVWNFFKNS